MIRPRSTPALLAAGVLLVACGARSSGGGRVQPSKGPVPEVLDLQEAWVWTAPAPGSVGMPAADPAAVAVTHGRQHLVLLDGAGKVRWQADRIGLRDVAPLLTADLVVAATDDGVAAYDRDGGRLRWEARLGERANTPVVSGGRVVVTTWEGSLVALELGDGKVAWRAKLGGDALGPAAAAGSTVVATFDTGRVAGAVAVDAATGRQRWAVSLVAGGVSAPAIAPGAGVVLAVAGDVAVHGLSLADGSERWRREVEGAGSPEVPPLPLPDGTVLAAHRQGGVVLFDPGDGAVRWQASSDGAAVRGGPAGPGPGGWFALPLDDGRLFLAWGEAVTDLRDPPGLVSGVAAGPGGSLLVATGQGKANSLTAVTGW